MVSHRATSAAARGSKLGGAAIEEAAQQVQMCEATAEALGVLDDALTSDITDLEVWCLNLNPLADCTVMWAIRSGHKQWDSDANQIVVTVLYVGHSLFETMNAQ